MEKVKGEKRKAEGESEKRKAESGKRKHANGPRLCRRPAAAAGAHPTAGISSEVSPK